jgi:hypothetical protein
MIHIYYRHYNVGGNISKNDNEHKARGSQRPEWFDYEICFKSLLKTIKNQDVKLNVIMDGDYENNWIAKYKKFYDLHEIKAGTDCLSFWKTNKIIKNNEAIKDNDLIYLLENDYMHLSGWVDKVNELFNLYNISGYVTLYDHLDKYYYEMYRDLVSKIIITNTHHWRTTPSTCGSFIVNKTTFDQDFDINSTWNGDHEKFLWLNKNRNRIVLSAVPGLSTHCVIGCESPTINWKNYSDTINNETIK